MRIVLLAILIVAVSVPAFAEGGWESEIGIKAGNASSRLVFGQQPDATDGIDGQYDIPAMMNGELQVAFDDGKQLWRDIRSAGSVSTWTINLLQVPVGSVTLTWNPGALPKMLLVDSETGRSLSMNENSSFVVNGSRRLEMKMEK